MKKSILVLLAFMSVAAFAGECEKSLFTGTFVYEDPNASVVLEDGTIKNDQWASFDFFDGERPATGDINRNGDATDISMLKNKSITMKQIDCDLVEVTYHTLSNRYFSPRYAHDIYTNTFFFSISPLELTNMGSENPEENFGFEKITWSKNKIVIESGKMGGLLGWRKYHIEISKLANGDLRIENTVKGFALLPVPLPGTFKNFYTLKKI